MTRVLLTGGSGFLASHILEALLTQGHSVVTTVRSQDKAKLIKDAHPKFGPDKLDFAIVQDVAQPGAFDQAVVSDPPFDGVIHTASPFHFNFKDARKEMLEPAINGTIGILRAAKAHAPSVKHVVITSSFAAITNPDAPPGYTFSEKDWNPVTEEEALQDVAKGYRGSKTFAERAAWDFMESEKPSFTLSMLNPPLMFGPVVPYLNSLNAVNTSNQRVRNLMLGQEKEGIAATGGVPFWIDVRDAAEMHIRAMARPAAGGKRFFATASTFGNADIAEIIRVKFPEYREGLPSTEKALAPGKLPPKGERWEQDDSQVREVLELELRGLEESIVDTVKSLQAMAG